MIQSARSFSPNELIRRVKRADVIVVGAGPAGQAVGHRLARAGLDTIVVESGSAGGNRRAEELSRGEHAGFLQAPLHEMRKRGLHGSARAWAGNLARLEDDDFDTRPWIDGSGWPLTAADVAGHLPDALAWLGSDLTLAELDEREQGWTADALLHTGELRVSAIAATSTSATRAKRAADLTADAESLVLCDLHVTRLATTPDGSRLSRLDAIIGGRQSVSIPVGAVVLTGGAIEVTRLLLASSDANHPTGLGNHADHLGRWYQDHPFAWCGSLHTDRPIDSLLFPAGGDRGPTAAGPLILASAERVAASRSTKVGVFVIADRPWMSGDAFHSRANTTVRRWKRAVRARHLPLDAGAGVGAITAGIGDLRRLRTERHQTVPNHHVVRVQVEPTPRPDSRLTLADGTDRHGVPLARIDWRLGDIERKATMEHLELVADQVANSGLGAFVPVPNRHDGWPKTIEVGYHPSGTTRMSGRPENGVVDPDLRVHGMQGLWVCSSSVFPTIGWANPTLTVAALGFRLADRIADSTDW